MRSIKNNNEEVYQFIGGDTNPTAKKVSNANGYTSDTYNKDDIISTLNKAVKANLITKSLKLVYENAKNIKYEFFVKSDNSVIKILVPNPDFHNIGIALTHRSLEAQFAESDEVGPYIKVEDRYITELDKISEDVVKIKLAKDKETIKQILVGVGLIATLTAGIILDGMFEQHMFGKHKYSQNAKNNTNNYSQNAKNSINNSNIERIVDEAINDNLDEINSRGRKL